MIRDLTESARSTHVDQLLTEARGAIGTRRLGAALNAFRKAADAGRVSEGLRRRVFNELLDGADAVTDSDWRLAESMLRLAEGLDSGFRAPDRIWQPIRHQLSEEYVKNVLDDVGNLESVDSLPGVRGRLLYALHRYPGEPRLTEQLKLIDRALEAPPVAAAPTPEAPKSPPSPSITPEQAIEPSAVVSENTAPDWNWAKGMGVAAAVLLLSGGVFFSVRGPKPAAVAPAKSVGTAATIRPESAKPAKSEEIAAPLPGLAKKLPPSAPKPDLHLASRVNAPKEIKKEIKTVELQAPPIHLERGNLLNNLQPAELSQARETLAEIERKAAQAESARADDAAWRLADGKTRAPIEEYLRQFPSGAHREEAEQALASLRAQEQASGAVLAMLRRYVSAWNAKDVDSITALHRSLDRKTIKAQLAPVTSLRMDITPASAAQIDGERATIVCRRQVFEVFSDGTEKQSPNAIVTFMLSKHGGEWSIDGTR